MDTRTINDVHTNLKQSMSALAGDPDPYPQVFQFEIPYLDPCGFQPPGDSELWVKNSQVLKYSWY